MSFGPIWFSCLNSDRSNHWCTINKPHSSQIRTLLKLIIGRNCFQFGNNFFLQKVGCAMGSTASPEICDITLHDLENQILQQDEHILTWWSYRDDILIIYGGNIDKSKQLVTTMNQMHPTLKFTFEASNSSINYLDLIIFKGNRFRETGILDTKVFTKPTETYQYLHKSSSHPPHGFNAFIYGETLRFARNTNNKENFKEKLEIFKNILIKRGYTHDEVNTKILKYHIRSATKLKNTSRLHDNLQPGTIPQGYFAGINKFWPQIQAIAHFRKYFRTLPSSLSKKTKIYEKLSSEQNYHQIPRI